jgi:putative ATPase
MLPLAVSTFTATQQCGMPESGIMLSHCCIQLALAKKSKASYLAFGKAMATVEENMNGGAAAQIPLYFPPLERTDCRHLRNAPTKLMKELGYGKEEEGVPREVSFCNIVLMESFFRQN